MFGSYDSNALRDPGSSINLDGGAFDCGEGSPTKTAHSPTWVTEGTWLNELSLRANLSLSTYHRFRIVVRRHSNSTNC